MILLRELVPLDWLTFWIGVGIVVIIIWYLRARHLEGSKTVKELRIKGSVGEVRDKILRWLEQNEFEVEGKKTQINAVRRFRLLNTIHFDLTLKREGGASLLYGEFYAKAGRGGPTYNLKEKCILGAWPRKKGFKLMNEFLEFLKER